MTTRRRLIFIAAATFIVGVVVAFPARVAYRALAPETVRLTGINGTVWNGSVVEGQIGGLYLRDLTWSLRPAALLTGRLAYDLSLEPAGGFLEADAAIGLGGGINLENVEGALSIGALRSGLPALRGIEGNVRLQLAELAVEGGLPTSADGTIEVFNLVARGLSSAPIGDFRAQLAPTDGGISGSIEDLTGVLDVAGSLRVSADRSYILEGLVAPKPEASEAIVSQLRFLGSANARGQHPFRLEGRL